MGLIGYEIIQSRVWVDPTNPAPPDLNYKLSFPITVFDAVRKDMMDENSETLTQVLDKISNELKARQTIIPAKPANYLMTYAGIAGQVGSIQISKEIPWNAEDQSNSRIPTEKAVGDLIRKLGIDPNNPNLELNTRWSDIIGRPNIYNSLGNDDNGIVSQTKITNEFNAINTKVDTMEETYGTMCNLLKTRLDDHVSNMNNPHNVTIQSIGAASAEALDSHVNAENPHSITAATLGLDRVDNTSDMNKPISIATQEAIDRINQLIDNMTDDVGELNFITNITYNKNTGELNLIYRDGSLIKMDSPLEESIKDLEYDSTTKELVIFSQAGVESRLSLADLFIRYEGSNGVNITVEIDGNQVTGTQVIKAHINPKSIKTADIANDAISERTIKAGAVTSSKLADGAVTNSKYADKSITSDKVAKHGLSNENLGKRIVNGRTLFSSSERCKILAVVTANSDPVWTEVHSEMIADEAVLASHIAKDAITHDKIADNAVSESNIEDLSVSTSKLKNRAVTTEKIATEAVTSEKLAPDLVFEGNPKLGNRPPLESNNNEIVDSRWVKDFAREKLVVETSNIGNRAVTGEKLFSSNIKDRVLAVLKANHDPVWTLINHGMMNSDSVGTNNIINKAVTADKIGDRAIESRHFSKHAIQLGHVGESAVDSFAIYTSFDANRVLAAVTDNGHPIYTQVNQEMMGQNSVGTWQLIDSSVTLSKMASSDESNMVMAVGLRRSTPVWSKILNQMIADRAVDGNKLFTSDSNNMILGVDRSGMNPTWMKLVGEMIADHTIKSINIGKKAIEGANIADDTIEARSIRDEAIESRHILPGAIKPEFLETSPIPGRVLGVAGLPYSTPMWMQVNTSMIKDKAITKEKIYQSEYPYRVLGATQAGVPPEYLMITHQFIVDGTIIPEKLVNDFVLFGTPSLTVQPVEDSNDYSLANTKWVRNTIDSKITELFNSDIVPEWVPKFDINFVPNHSIDGTKLFTSSYGPRVLGITEANGDVEFILIENNLIADAAVTSDKIERDICLLGAPEIEIRPSAFASDSTGDGNKIPDCQWVLDRINDAIGGTVFPGSSGSGSGATTTSIPQGSITAYHIQNRAIGGSQLFTSAVSNRLLGVGTANTSPTYLQANNEMIADRAVDGRTMFTSPKANKVLAVKSVNTDPEWTEINSGMIGDKVVNTEHIADKAINERNINNGAITTRTLANMPIIDEKRIFNRAVSKEKLADESVSTEKLIDESVTNRKIKDGTISGEKLAKELILPQNSSIQSSRNYEQKSIRNITISPNKPDGGLSGDIWFRFE